MDKGTLAHQILAPQGSPDTGWHRVPDPDDTPDRPRFVAWAQVAIGTVLTGIFRGTQNGQYGPFGLLELPSGATQHFGLPAILERRLRAVEPGQALRVTYLGTRPGKEGKSPYHCFEVETRELPRFPVGDGDPVDADDEVPF